MERMGTADIDGVAEKGSRVLLLDDIDELMRLFQPKVLRFVAFSIRDQDAAESITQDCFFKAYASRRQFRGDCSVKTWLIRIAFNLIRTHERGQKVRFWRKAVAVSVSPRHMCDYLRSTESSPEAQMLAKQRVEIVHRALEDLSIRQRSVFIMRFMEDLEIAEIAEMTEMPANTVKTHLHRAVTAIRARLGAGS
jgi:RNA polymerase sigma-70 factor (ECF subfamily)